MVDENSQAATLGVQSFPTKWDPILLQNSNEFNQNPILLRIKFRISKKTARARKSHLGAILRKVWKQNIILLKSHFIVNVLYSRGGGSTPLTTRNHLCRRSGLMKGIRAESD